MIDAREDVGTPVITTCPLLVRFAGDLYSVPADAHRFAPRGFTFEPQAGESLTDRLYTFAPYAFGTIRTPGTAPYQTWWA